jgi:multiple sugar transport system permease protein
LIYLLIGAIMSAWNDFQSPLIYISSESKFTIPVGIFNRFKYMDYTGTNFPNVQMALGVILSVPMAVVFIIFQRQLIDGIMMGSIKG